MISPPVFGIKSDGFPLCESWLSCLGRITTQWIGGWSCTERGFDPSLKNIRRVGPENHSHFSRFWGRVGDFDSSRWRKKVRGGLILILLWMMVRNRATWIRPFHRICGHPQLRIFSSSRPVPKNHAHCLFDIFQLLSYEQMGTGLTSGILFVLARGAAVALKIPRIITRIHPCISKASLKFRVEQELGSPYFDICRHLANQNMKPLLFCSFVSFLIWLFFNNC